mmetsp:Transcript_16787/g.48223  ORF Transcript_16787/g.48223 Transcript_16787/m.48223 type:complete len:943 (+) Transcript_16787:682-3510(+)
MSFSNHGRNSHRSVSVMVLSHSTGGAGTGRIGGGGGNYRPGGTASSGGKHHGAANRSSGTVKGPDLRIFVRDVSDKQGKKRPLTVRTWSTVKDVKDCLRQHLGVPPSSQRLYFGPLMTSGGELPNHRTLHDAGIYRSGETLLLEVKKSAGSNTGGGSTAGASALASLSCLSALGANDVCVSSSFLDVTPRGLRRTVCQARRGFAVGLKPDLVLDGSGGTYFLHDAHKAKVAVFKPADEEPYAANNPRGYIAATAQVDAGSGFGLNGGLDDGMRAGISPGEACIREVAAYLLDHGGFSGVPATTLAEARHPAFNSNGARLKLSEGGAAIGSHSLTLSSPTAEGGGVHVSPAHHSAILGKKVGSFQDFVHADYTMDDLSPSKLSVDEVHKIAILDIRILNADRNSANLLCRRKPEDPDNFELIPIDHGYCLRAVCDVCWFDWCWLDWPQLKKPLSRRSRDYILGLDIEADVRMLRERLHLKGEAIDYFRASSRLLQAGVKAGLSLYDIAVLCCRNDDAGEVPSKLEGLTAMASELAASAIANGRWHHSAAAASLVEQLASANKAAPLASSPSTPFSSGADSNKPSPKTLQFMFKSASSANFSSFMGDKKKKDGASPRLKSKSLDDAVQEEPEAAPPAVQSSGSDSSSDVELEHEDEEECEEWAAAVIADVSICDKDASSLLRLKQRSTSIGSESDSSSAASANHSASSRSSNMLSTSPVGFWYVRPGSEDEDDDQSRDVTWSPHLSPRASVVGLSSLALPAGVSPENLIPPLKELAEQRKSAVTFDISPIILPSPAPETEPEMEEGAVPSVPLTEMSLGENASGSDSAGMKPSDSSRSLLSRIPSKSAGLTRSQSYSAFSSRSSVGSGAGTAMPAVAARNLQKMTSLADDDEEQHHIYYLKFVALLIEGSITTVLRQREPAKKKNHEALPKSRNVAAVSFSAWD